MTRIIRIGLKRLGKNSQFIRRAGQGIVSDPSSGFSYTRKSDSIIAVLVGLSISTAYHKSKNITNA